MARCEQGRTRQEDNRWRVEQGSKRLSQAGTYSWDDELPGVRASQEIGM